jgi:hypothetical protein
VKNKSKGRSKSKKEAAEGVRFELTRAFALPVFKTSALNRSATPPGFRRARLFSHRRAGGQAGLCCSGAL